MHANSFDTVEQLMKHLTDPVTLGIPNAAQLHEDEGVVQKNDRGEKPLVKSPKNLFLPAFWLLFVLKHSLH